jgi:hypothetical protein
LVDVESRALAATLGCGLNRAIGLMNVLLVNWLDVYSAALPACDADRPEKYARKIGSGDVPVPGPK